MPELDSERLVKMRLGVTIVREGQLFDNLTTKSDFSYATRSH